MSTDRLSAIVHRLGELPALPLAAADALRVIDDPHGDAASVARAIEQDPALAAKILQVSNSSYYGMRQFVGTLKLALVVLGVREVRNIVTGVAVFDALGGGGAAAFQARLWDHSLLVGGIARQLETRLEAGLPGEAFLAGLLHDIGKLAIARHDGGAYAAMAQAHGAELCAAEREVYGFTHADVGAALAAHWHFPLPLIDAIRYHHTEDSAPLADAREPALAALVRIANLAAYDEHAETQDASLACADEEAWCVLAKVACPVAGAERFDTLKQIMTGLRAAPER
ncbi:MAG: HDOD domain-containing protein [Candidatus Hydrogenedentes bacterium]|nr:HDOD domain-containing protein [Candidatus Hydrogenedentota bacterium]